MAYGKEQIKEITNFTINTEDLSRSAATRRFDVTGEKDAEFTLQIFSTPAFTSVPNKFYNFSTKSFGVEQTPQNSLKIKMLYNKYHNRINFPANAGGDTYTFLLLTPKETTQLNFGTIVYSFSFFPLSFSGKFIIEFKLTPI